MWTKNPPDDITNDLVAGLIAAEETPLYARFPLAQEIKEAHGKNGMERVIIRYFILLMVTVNLLGVMMFGLRLMAPKPAMISVASLITYFAIAGFLAYQRPYRGNLLITDKRVVLQCNRFHWASGKLSINAEEIDRSYLDYDNGSRVLKLDVRGEKRPYIIARHDVYAARKAVRTLLGKTQ